MERDRFGIRHESGILRSGDGVPLFWQGLQPKGEPRGAVALVHGYNSASDYLLPLMTCLAEQGFATYAVDYRGHGRSGGPTRHVLRFNEYLMDVRALCDHVTEQCDDQKVFVFGNSLGGLIVSLYGLVHPHQFSGAVLTAPFFGPAFRVPCLLDLYSRAMSVCFPAYRVARRCPQVPEYVTLRWWTETLRAQQLWRMRAPQFRAPVLMLHGQDDSVACPRTARAMFERLGSKDKTLRLLPGAHHMDLDPSWGPEWWTEVRDWLLSRAQR